MCVTYTVIKNEKDIHNSWLYYFTNPLELGTRFTFASSAVYG